MRIYVPTPRRVAAPERRPLVAGTGRYRTEPAALLPLHLRRPYTREIANAPCRNGAESRGD